jgi:hypothetical protein
MSVGRLGRLFAVAVVAGAFLTPGSRSEPVSDCATRVLLAGPIGTAPCHGVRPGAAFSSPYVAGCTLNFLFRGSDGSRYMGTAGHCLFDQDDEVVGEAPPDRVAVWPRGHGPAIRSDSGAVVGEGAYAIQRPPRDFALIRLNRGVKASAQMCHFGGPTGLEESFDVPALLEHYGQGIGVSAVAPGRTAVTVDRGNADMFIAGGVGSNGDSGSGVMHEGRAIGVLVALTAPAPGDLYIGRVVPQLEDAERALRIKLTLQTAPRL